ncbi:MAG: hypothetical protein WEB58_20800 [Planctomycetaceae bacterium]
MTKTHQLSLFESESEETAKRTSTFVDNMSLPVHRWFRYSAGFSADWARSYIKNCAKEFDEIRVVDPFAGSGTSLLVANECGIPSYGVESHPFVARVARTKLLCTTSPHEYRTFAKAVLQRAKNYETDISPAYPDLIQKCFQGDKLAELDRLRRSFEESSDGSSKSELTWLTLVGILRSVSHVGTAQWQYVLPNKTKKNVLIPFDAFERMIEIFHRDMKKSQDYSSRAILVEGDARTCDGIPENFANLIITSPPYPNNYDYADATRLEMCFMKEIGGWSDLQETVRKHLVRSCSQQTTSSNVDLESTLEHGALNPIRDDIRRVCEQLGEIRQTKGGKKNYHLMVASYFLDLSLVWTALRRICDSPSNVCFVIGDSAPYGIYVPVIDWLGRLAVAAGFTEWSFRKIRDRNIKWKNRKHRVPLCEGHLLVKG